MLENIKVSDEMLKATDEDIQFDEYARQINSLYTQIHYRQKEILDKEIEVAFLKEEIEDINSKRPVISIKWRDSVKWCLTIDSRNFRFFLKTTGGVYKCIAFKNKIELDADIKNKVAVTLAALHKEGSIGRYSYNGTHLYGLKEFFTDDLTDLKEEHKVGLDRLILQ